MVLELNKKEISAVLMALLDTLEFLVKDYRELTDRLNQPPGLSVKEIRTLVCVCYQVTGVCKTIVFYISVINDKGDYDDQLKDMQELIEEMKAAVEPYELLSKRKSATNRDFN